MNRTYDESTNPSNGWSTAFDDMPSDDLDSIAVKNDPKGSTLHEQQCFKCRGSGRYGGYSSLGSQCFKCNGTGKLFFKLSAEQRAKGREASAKSKAKSLANSIAMWLEANPAAVAVFEAFQSDEFVKSLRDSLNKWGSLTEGQLSALLRKPAQEEAYKARKAAEAVARVEAVAVAPQVDVARMEAVFAKAKASGLRYPKFQAGRFKLKPAPASGINAGAIYVYGQFDVYFGKVKDGKFQKSRDCDTETEAAIVAMLADPFAAAVAHGRLTGNCSCCGRPLNNKLSVELGIGPICREKWGL